MSDDDVSCRACGDSGEYHYMLGESPIACPYCQLPPQPQPSERVDDAADGEEG